MFMAIEVHNGIIAADAKHGDGIHMVVLGGNGEVLETEIGMTVTVQKEHS
jgi:hypothetical protein